MTPVGFIGTRMLTAGPLGPGVLDRQPSRSVHDPWIEDKVNLDTASRPQLVEESPVRWRLERRDAMRVPGLVFASERLLPDVHGDRSLEQVANVATLPGIVGASYAMPDMHWGYGFPIGGVAATEVAADGVVSPGGVGFDISCGVRLLAAPFEQRELEPRLAALMDGLAAVIPRGMGGGGVWGDVDAGELERILTGGAVYAVSQGRGEPEDLQRCEDGGQLAGADPGQVSERACRRGSRQVGSLGSGNHFLEVQIVDRVLDEATAAVFGLHAGQVCVMIHCGSRGLGHQVCSDHVRTMREAMPRYGISVPDPQLACAPVESPEGSGYLGALAAAANYARANRQLLTEATRDAFARVTGRRDLRLVYDVSHNLAKIESHTLDSRRVRVCVHRKGATRAFPAGSADLPEDLRAVGQPVLLPGSMGTASYVMVGASPGEAFASTAHGAGRTMSRHEAKRRGHGGGVLRDELAALGIEVRAGSLRDLPEEAPYAYKDVEEVVSVCELAGLSRAVARMRPVGVVKG
jgi:tRNA-splicing ligase RtcB (3'-phosphate/5'-hydroxy nucleic acid ligase)